MDGRPDPRPQRRPRPGRSSSLKDVTTWVRLVLGGGTLDGEEIIGKDALAAPTLPHIVRAPLTSYDAQPQMYGLGSNIETDHLDFLRWSHSGAFSSGASRRRAAAAGAPRDRRADERDAAGRAEIIAEEILQQIALGTLARTGRRSAYQRLRLLPGVRADRAGRPHPGPRRRRLPRHLPRTTTTARPRSSAPTGAWHWSSDRAGSRCR